MQKKQRYKKLRDIAVITMGTSPSGDTYNTSKDGLPLLNGPTEFGDKYPNCTLYTIDSKRQSMVDDLIFCVRGSTTGKMNFSDKIYSLGRGVCSIRGKNKKETLYIKYAIDHRLKHLLNMANGGTFPNLRTEDILNFEIPYENVEKVATFLSNYDHLIENNSSRIKILEETAQKIYKEWFIDYKFTKGKKIKSKEWEVKKIKDVAEIFKGKSYKSLELSEKKEGLPFLNLKSIKRDGGFRRDGLKWFTGSYNENQIVNPEDIIMAVTDMTQERRLVARCARIPHNWYPKYAMSMDLVKIQPKKNVNKIYFYNFLKYSNFSDEIKNHANGANVLHLNPTVIENFEFLLPHIELRDEFAKIVDSIYKEMDILELKNTNLVQTRDILLPKLISGEIDVEKLEII